MFKKFNTPPTQAELTFMAKDTLTNAWLLENSPDTMVRKMDAMDCALPIDQVMVEWTTDHPGAGALWCRQETVLC